jgi:pimeloyl-ACP methyl ester carboxylesterase
MVPGSATTESARPPSSAGGAGAEILTGEFQQDGFRLAYSVSGRGQDDLVFIHGLYSSATAGLPLADQLSARHRIWAPDLPGHGGSGAFPAEASIEEAARAASLFIRARCDPPIKALIGYSMGCVVALRLAGSEPELLNSLILIAGPAVPDRIPLWARGLASPVFCHPTGIAMAAGIRAGEMAGRVLLRRNGLLRVLLSGAASADRRATIGLVQSASRLDPERVTRALHDTPCLVVHGTHDRIVRPFHALELQRLLPQSRLHWLSGVDHLAPYTDAKRVARLIDSFLKRL